jgi:hypothetical protein
MRYDDEKSRRRDKWDKKNSFKKKFKPKNKSLNNRGGDFDYDRNDRIQDYFGPPYDDET